MKVFAKPNLQLCCQESRYVAKAHGLNLFFWWFFHVLTTSQYVRTRSLLFIVRTRRFSPPGESRCKQNGRSPPWESKCKQTAADPHLKHFVLYISMECIQMYINSVCWVERESETTYCSSLVRRKDVFCWLIDGLIFHRLMRMEVHLRSIMIRTEDL